MKKTQFFAVSLILLLGFSISVQAQKKQQEPIVIQKEYYIEAPAEKVWQILADDFWGVYKWASNIDASKAKGEGTNGANCSERSCDLNAGGKHIDEKILRYDKANYLFEYEAFNGLPKMIIKAGNKWKLTSEGERTKVNLTVTMHTQGGMAKMMRGTITKKFSQFTDKVLVNDFKYFAENGKGSPEKQKAIAKYQKKK